tara:strand:- start:2732 stop:3853 length:1122 start_codon:yes stop_codon:yes gene_type:complete
MEIVHRYVKYKAGVLGSKKVATGQTQGIFVESARLKGKGATASKPTSVQILRRKAETMLREFLQSSKTFKISIIGALSFSAVLLAAVLHAKPIRRNVNPMTSQSLGLSSRVYQTVGMYAEQEDRYCYAMSSATNGDLIEIFAVFDGHGGGKVSSFLETNLAPRLMENLILTPDPADWPGVVKSTFKQVDEILNNSKLNIKEEGSTATLAVVQTNENGSHVLLANTGDSRSLVFLPDKNITAMKTVDHKPGEEPEKSRILAAGGRVIHHGVFRVNGILATSRSFGDSDLHPYVISEPDVYPAIWFDKTERANRPYLVVASDGFWDVLLNPTMLEECLRNREGEAKVDLATMERRLTSECIKRPVDNLTLIVAEL